MCGILGFSVSRLFQVRSRFPAVSKHVEKTEGHRGKGVERGGGGGGGWSRQQATKHT